MSQAPVSLDIPIDKEGDYSCLGDLVEDKEAIPPSEAGLLSALHHAVGDVLDMLTPRERRVLQLRFGLLDDHQRTLAEVGRRLGVTRARISRSKPSP